MMPLPKYRDSAEAVVITLQESKDGNLMVLHDLGSVLAACQDAPANQSILQELKTQGLDIRHAKVQVSLSASINIKNKLTGELFCRLLRALGDPTNMHCK